MNPNAQKQVRRHVTECLVKGSQIRQAFRMIADDGDDENKMKVLIDGDGMKLLMDVFSTYVSDEDYVDYIKFAKDVDKLLLKYRGGRPLTKEERQEMDEAAAPKKRSKKKKKAAPKPETESTENTESSNTEVTSSDVPKAISYFINKSRQEGSYRV